MLIEQSIQRLRAATNAGHQEQLILHFTHAQYYFPEQPRLDLLALIQITLDHNSEPVIEGCIAVCNPELLEQVQLLTDSDGVLKQYSQQHSLPWLVMSEPWLLAPIHIPKPWGQEIWYTGIESRGQAEVVGDGGNVPLPWLLELMPRRLGLKDNRQLILLKVLDPLAEEVYGDLYFELHQEKQEVYVVTHLDQQAWPEGIGTIQLGFAEQKRELFRDDQEFKQAYLSAVKEYEQVRRELDKKLDDKKREAGFEPCQAVDVTQLISWINEFSQLIENKELLLKENTLREAMNSFIAQHPLTVGDVVTVPKLFPHALQHGVRVVEFQTPVYERKILSFAQKVLTQDHWDTEEALGVVDMDFSRLQSPEPLDVNERMTVERIVNFDDFEVRRIRLDGEYLLVGDDYLVVMVVQGHLDLPSAGSTGGYRPGQALIVPRLERGWLVSGSDSCIFLVASPR